MKWSIEKQTVMGLGLASVILVSINALSFWSFIKHRETASSISHTHRVLQELETTASELKDAETGQRGYLITGRKYYLEPYYSGLPVVKQKFSSLRALTADNPEQLQRLSQLERLAARKIAFMEQTIDVRQEQGFTAAQKLIETNRGRTLMAQIRSLIRKMENTEQQLLQQRLAQELVAANRSQFLSSAGIVFNFVLFYLVYLAISRESKQRHRAQAALQQANTELEARVAARTEDLRLTNQQLQSSQTELRQSLEKEQELNQLKSRIITTISHEYRTPLTVIQSSAELLQVYGYKWSEEKKLTHLERIQKTVKHLTNLVSDVFFIGKAEANRLECKPKLLDLEAFCCELVEQMSSEINDLLAENGGVHTAGGTLSKTTAIAFSSHGNAVPAYLDEQLLRHILINLLSNAIKYSPQGSTVQFSLEWLPDRVKFCIQDEGIGIPEADQPQLFAFFHRASNVGNLPGTGLGLAIVKKSVELHDGEITLTSVVDQGTTFTVTLPLATNISTHKPLLYQAATK